MYLWLLPNNQTIQLFFSGCFFSGREVEAHGDLYHKAFSGSKRAGYEIAKVDLAISIKAHSTIGQAASIALVKHTY